MTSSCNCSSRGCAKTDLNFGSGQTEGENNYENCTRDHGIKFNEADHQEQRCLLILLEMAEFAFFCQYSFYLVYCVLLCRVFESRIGVTWAE